MTNISKYHTTLDFEMIACNLSLRTSILLDTERPLKVTEKILLTEV